MKIQITEWGVRNYNPPPSDGTLKAWARTGQIFPAPERVGRLIMVDEHAVRVPMTDYQDVDNLSPRALTILKAA